MKNREKRHEQEDNVSILRAAPPTRNPEKRNRQEKKGQSSPRPGRAAVFAWQKAWQQREYDNGRGCLGIPERLKASKHVALGEKAGFAVTKTMTLMTGNFELPAVDSCTCCICNVLAGLFGGEFTRREGTNILWASLWCCGRPGAGSPDASKLTGQG